VINNDDHAKCGTHPKKTQYQPINVKIGGKVMEKQMSFNMKCET
jgi:hypothetical protein